MTTLHFHNIAAGDLDVCWLEVGAARRIGHARAAVLGISTELAGLVEPLANGCRAAGPVQLAISLPASFTALYLMQGRPELVPMEALNRLAQTNPDQRDSLLWLGIVSALRQDNESAKGMLDRALKQNPLLGPARMWVGEILRTEGDIPGAIREQQRVLDQAPSNISAVRFLTLAYMDAGELGKARDLLESKRPEFEKNYMWRSARALLLAREGKRQDALDAMDQETLKFLSILYIATADAAEFYALLGDVPKAIEWFDRTVRNGDERVGWFRRDPRLAPIAQDPRFQSIVESVEARRKLRRAAR